ncbi:MAG: hypothetical protein JNK73_00385 [Bacteroidia bacterium]|nr:hypothetical protein [Bacteroidia bacterium]
MNLKLFSFALPLFVCGKLLAQNATITIKNKSNRYMYVKLMQGPERKAVLYKTDSIAPKSTSVIDVTQTGMYFMKTRAILFDENDPEKNDTIYSKDKPMQLISDNRRGHSNITIEFKVKEAKNPGTIAITRKEYDN